MAELIRKWTGLKETNTVHLFKHHGIAGVENFVIVLFGIVTEYKWNSFLKCSNHQSETCTSLKTQDFSMGTGFQDSLRFSKRSTSLFFYRSSVDGSDVDVYASVSLIPTAAHCYFIDAGHFLTCCPCIRWVASSGRWWWRRRREKRAGRWWGSQKPPTTCRVLITTHMTTVSILITLITGDIVFQYSIKVLVFIYFEVFSLAIINMCFLMATFFSRSKIASLLGPVIFSGSFFPFYAINDDDFTRTSKVSGCITLKLN